MSHWKWKLKRGTASINSAFKAGEQNIFRHAQQLVAVAADSMRLASNNRPAALKRLAYHTLKYGSAGILCRQLDMPLCEETAFIAFQASTMLFTYHAWEYCSQKLENILGLPFTRFKFSRTVAMFMAPTIIIIPMNFASSLIFQPKEYATFSAERAIKEDQLNRPEAAPIRAVDRVRVRGSEARR